MQAVQDAGSSEHHDNGLSCQVDIVTHIVFRLVLVKVSPRCNHSAYCTDGDDVCTCYGANRRPSGVCSQGQ